jgi:hypothetical protein
MSFFSRQFFALVNLTTVIKKAKLFSCNIFGQVYGLACILSMSPS